MNEKKEWVVDKLGHVGWIEGKYFHTPSYMTSDIQDLSPATEEDIAVTKKEISRRAKRRIEQGQIEQANLDLVGVGLTQDDFCRYRNSFVEDGCVVVCTRENGVGGFSADAVKKAGQRMIGRENDDGDSTYAYYTFEIKDGEDDNGSGGKIV